MFSNQKVTRELFNGNQSLQEHSHQNDFSQLQHDQLTQFDMSQPYSQDFFSQEQNSACSNSQSQGIRAPVIEKYMPKPSLFRNQSQSRISTLRPDQDESQTRNANVRSNIMASFDHQQLSKQKLKAKERDERDLLNSIVSMVRECTDEVKQNIKYASSAEADHIDVFQSSIRAFSESLEESSRKILKAIEVKDEHSNIISALERKLAQRDERILELLQKKHSHDEDSHSSMLNSLKTFILDQQSETEVKILKVLESTKEQLKATKELGNSHRQFSEVNSKQCADVKHANAKQVQEVEKRLIDELNMIRKDFGRQRSDFEAFFQNQMLSVHQEHLIAIEQHVENGMIEGLRQIPGKSNDIIEKWHSKLKAFCKSQQRDIEKYIQYQTREQTKQILKETQATHGKQQKFIHKEISDTLDDFKAGLRQILDENMKCLDELKHGFQHEGKKPWQNENVPKAVQDKLDELHNHHQSEIKRLEAEIESQQKKNDTPKKDDYTKNDAENAVNYILQNVFNLQQNTSGTLESNPCAKRSYGTSMFKNGPGLLSPRPPKGTSWNSRALFGRSNPSPIATVLPQRKAIQENMNCSIDPATATNEIDDQTVNARVLRNRSVGIKNVPNTLDNLAVSDTVLQSTNGRRRQRKPVQKIKADTKDSESTGYRSSETKRMKVNQQLCNKMNKKSKKVEDICSEDSPDAESQHTGRIALADKTEWSTASQTRNVCNDGSSQKNIFDFHDEASPVQGLMIQKKRPSLIGKQDIRNENKGQWLAASDSNSDDSSANSSPSLSVTDIFIQRQVQAPRRSTERKENHATHDVSGFYSSSDLTDMFTDKDKQFFNTKCNRMLQDVRPLSRVAGKRKFYDFEN